MITTKIKTVFCVGSLLLTLSACNSTNVLFKPTGKAAFVPENSVEFTKYVDDSRKNIETVLNELRPQSEKSLYLGGYTNQDAAKMRSPFQRPEVNSNRCDDISKGANKGFLLIHGLTDSPYLMRDISDSLNNGYPCALIRAVLLPGHGTLPGDTLKMKNQEWERITNYGVNSFKKDKIISDLYLVGFSTGTSLILNYLKGNKVSNGKSREDKIKGLVLISAAVKAKSGAAWLAPIVKEVKDWMKTFEEKDAARYESFSMNAAAQFYKLTKNMVNLEYIPNVPVLMAVSADDETIDAIAAREFFCSIKDERRALVWYQSIDPDVNAAIKKRQKLMCKNIVEIKLGDIEPKFKTVNLSHTALSMSPENPHYGVDGKYHNCKQYNDTQKFNDCQGDIKKNIYGATNIDGLKDDLKLKYDYLRRGTFNPDYENLEAKILCFTNDECPTSDILSLKIE